MSKDLQQIIDRAASDLTELCPITWSKEDVGLLLAARARLALLENACVKMNDDVCQTLGKALGYPWFKDDQKNFPGATEADGVCVGEHVAESIAMEAARQLGYPPMQSPPRSVWLGCCECDCSFACFEGKSPCIRLQPVAT